MVTDSAMPAAAAQWPEAVEVLNEEGRSPIVLICEHASNYIPAEYAGLGLPATELSRHIAWDIGAADVTRTLSRLLDAPAFLATYSRLLIDLNRPLQVAAAIPIRSEATDIPGNVDLAPAERERRSQRIFTPFHERLGSHIARRERTGRGSVLVAIHSFTPVFHGQARSWHAGVLFGEAARFGRSLIERLRSDPALNVDANVPYGVSRDEDYALIVHGDDRGNPAVLIEIRNDLIAHRTGADDWAQRLAAALADEPWQGSSR
jgi:predicted N-formylglutamate amidohydrolase